jgi:predicted RNA-binding protein YlxR (DUF448 family)
MGQPRPRRSGAGPRPERPDGQGVRTCVVCRDRSSSRLMVRFVLAEAGRATLDGSPHHPGRGAWCCLRGACLRAIKPGNISRGVKAEVRRLDDPLPALRMKVVLRVRQALLRAWRSGLLVDVLRLGAAGPPPVAVCGLQGDDPPSEAHPACVGLPIHMLPLSRGELQALFGLHPSGGFSGGVVIRAGRPSRALRDELRCLHDLG